MEKERTKKEKKRGRPYKDELQDAEGGEEGPEATRDDQNDASADTDLEYLSCHNKSSVRIRKR